jgi:hypothetical protein
LLKYSSEALAKLTPQMVVQRLNNFIVRAPTGHKAADLSPLVCQPAYVNAAPRNRCPAACLCWLQIGQEDAKKAVSIGASTHHACAYVATTRCSPRRMEQPVIRVCARTDAPQVAVAFRNRWRRHRVPADIREDITPKVGTEQLHSPCLSPQ